MGNIVPAPSRQDEDIFGKPLLQPAALIFLVVPIDAGGANQLISRKSGDHRGGRPHWRRHKILPLLHKIGDSGKHVLRAEMYAFCSDSLSIFQRFKAMDTGTRFTRE
jgi:hypothetical protein